ncbi:Lipopolysaccharide export system ATP-binding protein LptB [Streptomyces sp. RB5]|uniref:Lipopolysaccharide export system ATP-binding protein LptB n=1 Tax=Streptomyces smaragdinus TaxID=2585196 RepID=A0A7K0CA38_9ACTN|nr:ABC transporter ATP-binding protein [Streptomyces smaragdinus]MQY10288.1 Lipopolysaccharide export system ATP-binding protein LptB [Streptomyces smaragdinus]
MTLRHAVLRTHQLGKEFNGFHAVSGVDLAVLQGTVHALVGPNGAGKTTLFNLLTGFLPATSGRIELDGRDITGAPPERIARLGVARSFQVTSLFPQMTAREHVELALQAGTGLGRRLWVSEKRMSRFTARARELLAEVGLEKVAERAAGALPYGQKRSLELALALALDPKVLLLDEPTAGMGLEDVERTVELVGRIRAGRTVVMVEHNMSVVGTLADTVTVLQRGEILAEGPYEQVKTDPRVVEAYLGAEVA